MSHLEPLGASLRFITKLFDPSNVIICIINSGCVVCGGGIEISQGCAVCMLRPNICLCGIQQGVHITGLLRDTLIFVLSYGFFYYVITSNNNFLTSLKNVCFQLTFHYLCLFKLELIFNSISSGFCCFFHVWC